MKYASQKVMENEASVIRNEMEKMTTEELSKEVEKLRVTEPNNQKTILFSMELKKRIIWDSKFKNSKSVFSR
ncbi:MAG: hypothetical protein IJ638_01220 [Alphaproteobacteria bacterium]|nr:hypothetical protein [Alphaproteobacteria bacterium]